MRCNIPEGVEIYLSADLIRPLVLGKKIMSVTLSGRYSAKKPKPEGFVEFMNDLQTTIRHPVLPGGRVIDIRTKGKFMYWIFTHDWYMFCTFGMSGQWSPKEGKHPCLSFWFDDESYLYFNDPRHFGTIKFVKGEAQLKKKLLQLGWDPLHGISDFNLLWVASKLKSCNKPIGQVLMDQSIFAGVGNYIRAEALYLSKMSPWRLANTLVEEEVYDLCDNIRDVMQESYDHQGATIHTYATPFGEEGKYSSCFKVYGQTHDPLGNLIKKETTPEGRTIHWCPAIQS